MGNNVFQNIDVIKALVKVKYKDLGEAELYKIIDHIGKHQDQDRKQLSNEEQIIKDILLRANYKPKGVRFWFLALNLPRHLQIQIKENKITYNQARKLYSQYKIRDDSSLEYEIMQDIRKFVSNLQKFEFRNSEEKV